MASLLSKNFTSKMLATPDKIAHNLDWRKVSAAVLTLNILSDRIELALASHPSLEEAVYKLPTIPIKYHVENKTRNLSKQTLDELANVIKDNNVCGLVVNWPVQEEGWAGARCGRVMYTLDQLAKNKVVTSNRPVCLWDKDHMDFEEDSWGRSPVYSQTSNKSVHVASQEQYKDKNTAVADIWNDFCRSHWPELYQEEEDEEESFFRLSSTQNSQSTERPFKWSSSLLQPHTKTSSRYMKA